MRIYAIKIIAIIVFLPALISVILLLFGFLDIRYMLIINVISFFIEFILFLTFISIMMKRINTTGVVIPKVSFTERKIRANTEIFEKYIRPTNPLSNCVFRIMIELKEFEETPKVFIIRKCQKDTCEQLLNDDSFLDLGKLHVFDVKVDRTEILNFKFDKNVIVKSFSIEELYEA